MNRRAGIAAMVSLGALLCCGATTSPTGCQPQPSFTGYKVAAVAIVAGVVIGTIVLVEVPKSHHNVKGCLFSGPNGLQLLDPGSTFTYTLTGETPSLKVGDKVHLHGNKEKQAKGSPAGRTFVVQNLVKDFGPCKAIPIPTAPTS